MLRQTETKDTYIRARVTDQEKEQVTIRRKELGMTEADYIRYCINREMEEDK